MVLTHAQLLQPTALKKEEHLQQERDRAIVCVPYPVDGGTQVEGTELVTKADSAEASGEGQTEERGTRQKTNPRSSQLRCLEKTRWGSVRLKGL